MLRAGALRLGKIDSREIFLEFGKAIRELGLAVTQCGFGLWLV